MDLDPIPVQLPVRGVARGVAFSRQHPKTTRRALNVRVEEPHSGVRRIASRAGQRLELEGPVSAAGVPVDDVLVEPYQQPADTFEQLGGLGDDLETEWERVGPLGDSALDVWVNGQRDSFWLTSGGSVLKRNGDGIQVWQQPVPLRATEGVAPRMAISPLGDVYVASSTTRSGSGARLWKLSPRQDDDGLDVEWFVDLEQNEVTDIAYDAGRLLVVANAALDEAGFYLIVENALEGQGYLLSETRVPFPVTCLAVGDRGAYCGMPPNPDRGPAPVGDGYELGTESQTPLDWGSDELHAWLRAEDAGVFPNGQPVGRVQDARLLLGAQPDDETERSWVHSRFHAYYGEDLRGNQMPRYLASGAGQLPALSLRPEWGDVDHTPTRWWDNGAGLSSELNNLLGIAGHRSDKESTSDSLPGSKGVWPITFSHTFAVSFLVRWEPGWPAQVLWHIGGADWETPRPGYLALAINYDSTLTTHPAYEEDWFEQMGASPREDGGVALLRGPTSGEAGGPFLLATGRATDYDDSDLRYALITVVKNTGGTGYLRVNGTNWHNFDGTGSNVLDDSFLSTHNEVFGNRVYSESDVSTNRFLAWLDSFAGSFVEAACRMGPTTTTPHDTDMDTFTVGGNGERVVEMEGYLAHRYGIADHVLADGSGSSTLHPYRAAPPSGTGGQTVDPTETAAALQSTDGLLVKVGLGSGDILWAKRGSGHGDGLVAGENGVVFHAGQRLAPEGSGIDDEVGPRARVVGKVIDRGLLVDQRRESRGELVLSSVPADGSAVQIHDGARSIWFEFNATPANVRPGNIGLDTTGANLETAAALLSNAITLADPNVELNAYAERTEPDISPVQRIAIYSREAPDETERAIVLSADQGVTPGSVTGLEVASGMDGGESADGAWNVTATADEGLRNRSIRMAVDADGHLHLPWCTTLEPNRYRKLRATDGREMFDQRVGGEHTAQLNAVALEVASEDFQPEATGPELAWLGLSHLDSAGAIVGREHETQTALRLVRRAVATRPAYLMGRLAVSGGTIHTWEPGGAAEALPGGPHLASEAPYFLSATLYGESFLSDGRSRWVYNHRKGTLREWQVVGSGEIPQRFSVLEPWNERLVLAQGSRLYMSARGEPYNWHLFPPEPSASQAWAGGIVVGPERKPDPITGFAPIVDDLALVGGRTQLHRMTGDPMLGGALDLVSRTTGMRPGRSWALLPRGKVVFHGFPSGIWSYSAGGGLREISRGRIERELQELEEAGHAIRPIYSEAEHGVHFFVVPGDGSAGLLDWWFWDMEADAWFPNRWALKEYQPRSVACEDREVVLGCEDGRIARIALDTDYDRGVPFGSRVLVGPILSDAFPYESRWQDLELVLGERTAAVDVSQFSGETDESLEHPVERCQAEGGRAEIIPEAVTAAAYWFEVSSTDGPWSLESARVWRSLMSRKARR